MDLSSIPFNSLARGVEGQKQEIIEAIDRVVSSGWFVMGPEHEAFEAELQDYLGIKHALNVANGTDALEIALAAVGVRRGGKVITVANAGGYTSTATLLLGAEPIYCDVDPTTLLMSPETLLNSLAVTDQKPDAIVVTHLYGAMAPMVEIMSIARDHQIPVIEDCAQALGARSAGKLAGTFADVSTTSFYPTKNLGALGDGGAIFTNNDEYASKIRKMRQYGWSTKYKIDNARGKNSRLDEIQAAVLRIKLPKLDLNNERRKQIHSVYELVEHQGMRILNRSGESFIGHLAVVIPQNREAVITKLNSRNISTEIHYPMPDNKQKFLDFIPPKFQLPVTEWASNAVLSIPIFPELTEFEVTRIAKELSEC